MLKTQRTVTFRLQEPFAVLIIFSKLVGNNGHQITTLVLQIACYENLIKKCLSFKSFCDLFCIIQVFMFYIADCQFW